MLIDCLLFHSKMEMMDPTRDFLDKYYMPLVGSKDFKKLIDNEPFFDQPVKNKQEAYEELIEMSRNDDYTTGNLLDYLYRQNYYKLIVISLSRQTNITIPRQISFTGKLEKDEQKTRKQQKTILGVSLDLLLVTE